MVDRIYYKIGLIIKIKKLISISFLLVYCIGFAQEGNNKKSKISYKPEIAISFSGGFHALGPMKALKDQMEENGYGHTSTSFLGGRTEYPDIRREGSFDVELTVFFKRRKGISIGFGQIRNDKIEGFHRQGSSFLGTVGPRISFSDRSQVIYLNYVLRSHNTHHVLLVGPSLLHQSIKGKLRGEPDISSSEHKVGIQVGYQLNFSKRTFIVGIRTSYLWFSSTDIGPYVPIDVPESVSKPIFEKVEAPSHNLNVHLVLGLKLTQRKKRY